MICTKLPTCRLSAVASKPMYAVEPRGVRLLMDVAALGESAQKVGFVFNHGCGDR